MLIGKDSPTGTFGQLSLISKVQKRIKSHFVI